MWCILPCLIAYSPTMFNLLSQLLNIHTPKFESDGKLWPIVHYSTTFSLVLMHVIAIGIFGLKNLPLASCLIIPLPIITLVFNEYCRKRFVPMFKDYPLEVLGSPISSYFFIFFSDRFEILVYSYCILGIGKVSVHISYEALRYISHITC